MKHLILPLLCAFYSILACTYNESQLQDDSTLSSLSDAELSSCFSKFLNNPNISSKILKTNRCHVAEKDTKHVLNNLSVFDEKFVYNLLRYDQHPQAANFPSLNPRSDDGLKIIKLLFSADSENRDLYPSFGDHIPELYDDQPADGEDYSNFYRQTLSFKKVANYFGDKFISDMGVPKFTKEAGAWVADGIEEIEGMNHLSAIRLVYDTLIMMNSSGESKYFYNIDPSVYTQSLETFKRAMIITRILQMCDPGDSDDENYNQKLNESFMNINLLSGSIIATLKNAPLNFELVIPWGWNGFQHISGHAMLLIIQKESVSSFSISIINTGTGKTHHVEQYDTHFISKINPYLTFAGVTSEELFDTDFIFQALSIIWFAPRESKKNQKTTSSSYDILRPEDLYNLVQSRFSSKLVIQNDLKIYAQNSGTCSMRSTHTYLKIRTGEFSLVFRIQFEFTILKTLVEIINGKADGDKYLLDGKENDEFSTYADGNEVRGLFRFAFRSFVRLVIKGIKSGDGRIVKLSDDADNIIRLISDWKQVFDRVKSPTNPSIQQVVFSKALIREFKNVNQFVPPTFKSSKFDFDGLSYESLKPNSTLSNLLDNIAIIGNFANPSDTGGDFNIRLYYLVESVLSLSLPDASEPCSEHEEFHNSRFHSALSSIVSISQAIYNLPMEDEGNGMQFSTILSQFKLLALAWRFQLYIDSQMHDEVKDKKRPRLCQYRLDTTPQFDYLKRSMSLPLDRKLDEQLERLESYFNGIGKKSKTLFSYADGIVLPIVDGLSSSMGYFEDVYAYLGTKYDISAQTCIDDVKKQGTECNIEDMRRAAISCMWFYEHKDEYIDKKMVLTESFRYLQIVSLIASHAILRKDREQRLDKPTSILERFSLENQSDSSNPICKATFDPTYVSQKTKLFTNHNLLPLESRTNLSEPLVKVLLTPKRSENQLIMDDHVPVEYRHLYYPVMYSQVSLSIIIHYLEEKIFDFVSYNKETEEFGTDLALLDFGILNYGSLSSILSWQPNVYKVITQALENYRSDYLKKLSNLDTIKSEEAQNFHVVAYLHLWSILRSIDDYAVSNPDLELPSVSDKRREEIELLESPLFVHVFNHHNVGSFAKNVLLGSFTYQKLVSDEDVQEMLVLNASSTYFASVVKDAKFKCDVRIRHLARRALLIHNDSIATFLRKGSIRTSPVMNRILQVYGYATIGNWKTDNVSDNITPKKFIPESTADQKYMICPLQGTLYVNKELVENAQAVLQELDLYQSTFRNYKFRNVSRKGEIGSLQFKARTNEPDMEYYFDFSNAIPKIWKQKSPLLEEPIVWRYYLNPKFSLRKSPHNLHYQHWIQTRTVNSKSILNYHIVDLDDMDPTKPSANENFIYNVNFDVVTGDIADAEYGEYGEFQHVMHEAFKRFEPDTNFVTGFESEGVKHILFSRYKSESFKENLEFFLEDAKWKLKENPKFYIEIGVDSQRLEYFELRSILHSFLVLTTEPDAEGAVTRKAILPIKQVLDDPVVDFINFVVVDVASDGSLVPRTRLELLVVAYYLQSYNLHRKAFKTLKNVPQYSPFDSQRELELLYWIYSGKRKVQSVVDGEETLLDSYAPFAPNAVSVRILAAWLVFENWRTFPVAYSLRDIDEDPIRKEWIGTLDASIEETKKDDDNDEASLVKLMAYYYKVQGHIHTDLKLHDKYWNSYEENVFIRSMTNQPPHSAIYQDYNVFSARMMILKGTFDRLPETAKTAMGAFSHKKSLNITPGQIGVYKKLFGEPNLFDLSECGTKLITLNHIRPDPLHLSSRVIRFCKCMDSDPSFKSRILHFVDSSRYDTKDTVKIARILLHSYASPDTDSKQAIQRMLQSSSLSDEEYQSLDELVVIVAREISGIDDKTSPMFELESIELDLELPEIAAEKIGIAFSDDDFNALELLRQRIWSNGKCKYAYYEDGHALPVVVFSNSRASDKGPVVFSDSVSEKFSQEINEEIRLGTVKNREEISGKKYAGGSIDPVVADLEREKIALEAICEGIEISLTSMVEGTGEEQKLSLLGKISGRNKSLKIKSLIPYFVRRDRKLYEDNLAFNGTLDVARVHRLVGKYLYIMTYKQLLERSILHLKNDDFERFKDEMFALKDDLYHKHEYFAEFVTFEYRANFKLRPTQKEDLASLMPKNGQFDNILIQRLMAAGKTYVLGTMSAFMVADGYHLSMIMPPSSLYETNSTDMFSRTTKFFAQKANFLSFDRSREQFTLDALEWILNVLLRTIRNREYIMVAPETLSSLQNKFVELLMVIPFAEERNDELEETVEKFFVLYKILKLIRLRAVLTADEIDMTWDPKKELNFPGRRKEHPIAIQTRLVVEFFMKVSYSTEIADAGLDFQQNRQATLTAEKYWENVQPLLAAKAGQAIQEVIGEQLNRMLGSAKNWEQFGLEFVGDKNRKVNSDLFREYVGKANGHLTQETLVECLAILWFIVNEWLPESIKSTVSEHFGFSFADPDYDLAKPYLHVNTPSEKSEFSDRWETLIKTCIMYVHRKLNAHRMSKMIKAAQKKAIAEWMQSDSLDDIDQSFVSREFADILPAGFQPLSKIQTDCEGQSGCRIEELVRYVHSDDGKQLLKWFIEHVSIPSLVIFPDQIHNTPQNLGTVSFVLRAYTGTIPNSYIFNNRLNIQKDQGSNGRVISKLRETVDQDRILTPVLADMEVGTLLGSILGGFPNTRALIDIGAHFKNKENRLIAQDMAVYFKNDAAFGVKGVLYFDDVSKMLCCVKTSQPDIEIVLPDTSKESIKSFTELDPEELFTFYDQSKITGADILQFLYAEAAITIGPKTKMRDLLQGVMRMRKFLESQRVYFVITENIETYLRSLTSTADDLEMDDIIRFVSINSFDSFEVEDRTVLFQKLSNVVRQAILDWMLTIDEKLDGYKDFDSIKKVFEETRFLFARSLKKNLSSAYSMSVDMVKAETMLKNMIEKYLEHLNEEHSLEAVKQELDQIASEFVDRNPKAEFQQPTVGMELESEPPAGALLQQEQQIEQQSENVNIVTPKKPDGTAKLFVPWTKPKVILYDADSDSEFTPKIYKLQDAIKTLRFNDESFKSHAISLFDDLLVTENFLFTIQDSASLFDAEQKRVFHILVHRKDGYACLLSLDDSLYWKNALLKEKTDEFVLMTPSGLVLAPVESQSVFPNLSKIQLQAMTVSRSTLLYTNQVHRRTLLQSFSTYGIQKLSFYESFVFTQTLEYETSTLSSIFETLRNSHFVKTLNLINYHFSKNISSASLDLEIFAFKKKHNKLTDGLNCSDFPCALNHLSEYDLLVTITPECISQIDPVHFTDIYASTLSLLDLRVLKSLTKEQFLQIKDQAWNAFRTEHLSAMTVPSKENKSFCESLKKSLVFVSDHDVLEYFYQVCYGFVGSGSILRVGFVSLVSMFVWFLFQ